jgi:hypothetical protein
MNSLLIEQDLRKYFVDKWHIFRKQSDENASLYVLRRMEKISWTDRVRNEEVLHRVTEERNIVHTIKRRKAN